MGKTSQSKKLNFLEIILKNKWRVFLFLFVLSIIVSIPLMLTHKIAFGHDLTFHLSRINAIKDNFISGNMFSSIYPNYLNGYGYGAPLFYPDIFLHIPGFLAYLGLSVENSYKIFLWLISFCSMLTMYHSVKGISQSQKIALISAILYCFAPYRLTDLYTRAALGESLAFIFAPLVIYGIYQIIHKDFKKFYLLVIGMSGLILSHIISAYIFSILLIIICLINYKQFLLEKKRILYLGVAVLTTLALTSFFTFPMFEQIFSTNFSFNIFPLLYNNSMPLIALIIDFPIRITEIPYFPICLGIGLLIMIILYLKDIKHYKNEPFMRFCFVCSIVVLLISTNIFPWHLFRPIIEYIQFPYRIVMISTVLLSIGIAVLAAKIPDNKKKLFGIAFCLSFMSFYFITNHYLVLSDMVFIPQQSQYTTKDEIVFGEYLPAKMSNCLEACYKNRGMVVTSKDPAEINFQKTENNVIIEFTNTGEGNEFELPLTYYKGYRALLNNKSLKVYETDNGLVGIKIDNYTSGRIYVDYYGTFIQHISKYISIISWILFCLYVSLSIKRERVKNL